MSVLSENPDVVMAALAVCVERLGGYVKFTAEEASNPGGEIMSRVDVDGLLELKTVEKEVGQCLKRLNAISACSGHGKRGGSLGTKTISQSLMLCGRLKRFAPKGPV